MEAAAALRKARIDALRRLRQAEDTQDQRAIDENEFGRAVKASFRSSVPPPGVLSQQPTVLDTLEHDIAGLQERVIAEDEAEQEKKLVRRRKLISGSCGDRAQTAKLGPAPRVRPARRAARAADQACDPCADRCVVAY